MDQLMDQPVDQPVVERAISASTFRDVIGRFATGVTVVTVAPGGERRGMTANAVASVSLDPPLLLVCVRKAASTHDPLMEAGAFAVNILGDDQRDVSEFFSHRAEGADLMGGYPYRLGETGSPILERTLGWLDCRIWERYEGGDHTIAIGEVIDLELTRPESGPLLFYASTYRQIGDPT